MSFAGFLWFLLTLVPLVLLQRLLHREIQAVLLLITRSPWLTITLFSLLFLPGVFLHELSHYVMAKLLRVKTGKFSLIPAMLPDGRLQMGYVETGRGGAFRDSLIGAAPLIFGSLALAYIGNVPLDVDSLWRVFSQYGNFGLLLQGILSIPQIPHFYPWFYLAFTISSTMMPSASDRHAWLELAGWAAVPLLLAIFAGAGGWMVAHLAPPLNSFLVPVALIFGFSIALQIVLLIPALLIHRILTRVTGLDVQ